MVTYLFSYCYVIVQDIYFSLFAMGFVTVYGMFCIQHFLTEQSGNSIQEPTNTKDLSCNALRNKHTVNEYDVRCPVFMAFTASSSELHPGAAGGTGETARESTVLRSGHWKYVVTCNLPPFLVFLQFKEFELLNLRATAALLRLPAALWYLLGIGLLHHQLLLLLCCLWICLWVHSGTRTQMHTHPRLFTSCDRQSKMWLGTFLKCFLLWEQLPI